MILFKNLVLGISICVIIAFLISVFFIVYNALKEKNKEWIYVWKVRTIYLMRMLQRRKMTSYTINEATKEEEIFIDREDIPLILLLLPLLIMMGFYNLLLNLSRRENDR